jgi:hypothetical protein
MLGSKRYDRGKLTAKPQLSPLGGRPACDASFQ